MNSTESAPLAGFHFSRWVACLPLLIMIIPAVALSMQGILSKAVIISGGVIGLMVGSILARNRKEYWDVVTRALGDPTGLLILPLFLIVGIYGKLLSAAHLPEGMLWLSNLVNAGPTLFALFIYVTCAVLGIAMGTSLGIVVIMTPVLYPMAVSLGVPPALAAGAILSGAATGDHFAPVSDTTIISASTQHYRNSPGSADIGEVVRARFKYAFPAFLVSCALYLLVGVLSSHVDPALAGHAAGQADPVGLIMLLPMLAVVIVAVRSGNVFEALTWGTLAAILVGLAMDLISVGELFHIADGTPSGLIIEGTLENVDTVVMIIMMMGAYGVMRAYGLLDELVARIMQTTGNSPRSGELTMFGIGWLLNFLLVGLVARITVIGGPIFDEIGRSQNIHPVRRANILDGVANSFSFIVPWHVWPLIMVAAITPLVETTPGPAIPALTDFLYYTYYPVAIWVVMLLAVITGYGRKFE
jgi:Na+/H+ antiporter NhaC